MGLAHFTIADHSMVEISTIFKKTLYTKEMMDRAIKHYLAALHRQKQEQRKKKLEKINKINGERQ